MAVCSFGAPAPGAAFGAPTPSADLSLDPEITQSLKRLTKRDTSTKLKALKTLNTRLYDVSQDGCAELLPSWLFHYKKLVMDNTRSVRLEAVQVLAVIVSKAGKHTAPHVKELIGPWWLAASDPYADAASAATASFKVQLHLLPICCAVLVVSQFNCA